jgi:hypothetical protein
MALAPIALFVYNRPTHTRQTVEALRANPLAASTELHVFSDGPRTPETAPRIREVREYLKTIVGFAKVTVHERDRNFGLAASVIDGVTRLCGAAGRVIVVEDDLLVAPHFLDYMNSALERYHDEAEVMQVSGYMFPIDVAAEADAFFMPFTTSWGWATWERAWQYFDPAMTGFDALAGNRQLRDRFNLGGAYDYFDMLERQRGGSIDSWAIRWYLSVFMRNGLTLYPARTLVRNIGFDGSGTHCVDADVEQAEQAAMQPHFRVEKFPTRIQLRPDWKRVLAALPVRRRRAGDLMRNVATKAGRILQSWKLGQR